ncbi:MAG: FG-GAP-like repeat-containing protein [Elusimicrobiota bacterium]|jgi:hypothetical protein
MLNLLLSLFLACPVQAQSSLDGYVVKVEGSKIYLDLGEASGAKTGDAFTIYRPGEELKHPVTGASLGRTETNLAAGHVSEVLEKYSLAGIEGAQPASASTVNPGDRVRVHRAAVQVPAAAAPATTASTTAQAPAPGAHAPVRTSPSLDLEAVALALGDVDGDGKTEVILADKDSVKAYSAEDWHPVCAFKDPGTAITNLSLEAEDLDKDGRAEVFLTLNNRFFDRVESYVLVCSSGSFEKRTTLAWMVRRYMDGTQSLLAAQPLIKNATFPFGPIHPLTYADGRYTLGEPKLKLPRLDWIYSFAVARSAEGSFPLFYTPNNRIRLQFEKRAAFSSEAYGQTSNRIRWADRTLQCSPRLVAAPSAEGISAVYTLKNIPRFGSLSEAFGAYSSAELHCLRFNGLNLEPDWKADLPGYAADLAERALPNGMRELVTAVVGANGKTRVLSFTP